MSSLEENVPDDITFFLSRASIQDLREAKERELSKGPMLARWWFIRLIGVELLDRKPKHNRRSF